MSEAEALATVEELSEFLPFELDPNEIGEAQLALDSLSDDARFYGRDHWLTPEATPGPVRRLVLRAANRHMKNYEGYVQSRAGDETLEWAEGDSPGTAEFTDDEISRLTAYAGRTSGGGFASVATTAWSTRAPATWDCWGNPTTDQYVPTESGTWMPWVAGD